MRVSDWLSSCQQVVILQHTGGLVGRVSDSGPIDSCSIPEPAKDPSCILLVADALLIPSWSQCPPGLNYTFRGAGLGAALSPRSGSQLRDISYPLLKIPYTLR